LEGALDLSFDRLLMMMMMMMISIKVKILYRLYMHCIWNIDTVILVLLGLSRRPYMS